MNTLATIAAAAYLLGIIIIFVVCLPLALEAINIAVRMWRFERDVLVMFPKQISDENLRIVAKKRLLSEGHVLRSLNVIITHLLTKQNIDENSNSPEAVALKTLKTIRLEHEHDLPIRGIPASLRFYIMKVREAIPNQREEFIAPLVEQLVEYQAVEQRKRYVAVLFGAASFVLGIIGVDWAKVASWFH